jgi:hypothetical protein
MNSSQVVVDCPICFDDIDVNKNSVVTECGHKFHASCLLRSIAHGNFDCPCCRFELAEKPEDSDDGYDEEDDDEDEIEDEIMQSMRWMFQRAEGEELEEEFEEEEEDQVPDVPLSYIMENLTTMDYNFEDMVRILLNDFLDNDQDERSIGILETVNGLIDRYDGEVLVTPNTEVPVSTEVPVAPNTEVPVAPKSENDDSDDEDDHSEDLKSFVPKINFNVVKRYQATSWLCGNN